MTLAEQIRAAQRELAQVRAQANSTVSSIGGWEPASRSSMHAVASMPGCGWARSRDHTRYLLRQEIRAAERKLKALLNEDLKALARQDGERLKAAHPYIFEDGRERGRQADRKRPEWFNEGEGSRDQRASLMAGLDAGRRERRSGRCEDRANQGILIP
jgi:hypothetical protein